MSEIPEKKKRNRQACDGCRRKRSKCCGTRPCAPCLASDTVCTYTTPRKRGVPAGLIQRLETSNEKLISIISLIFEANEHALVDAVAKLDMEPPHITKSRNSKIRPQLSSIIKLEDSSSSTASALRKLPTGAKGSGALEDGGHMSEDGVSLETTNQRDGREASIPSELDYSPDKHSKHVHGSLTPDSGEDLNPASAESQIKIMGLSSGFDQSFIASFHRLRLSKVMFDPPYWKTLTAPFSFMELLHMYFEWTHCIIPMVEKTRLVQLIYSPDADKKSGESCLLWSTILMGMNHAAEVADQDLERSRMMHDLTICTLDCKYSVESVQALLLQSYYFFGKGHWANAWLIVGNAVRMANTLGIHIPDVHQNDSVKRRTWKCCCIIDTMISCRLGRVPQVSKDNYTPIEELETTEEWELWRCDRVQKDLITPSRMVSTFNEYYKLTMIVNEFITDANSAGITASQRVELVKTTGVKLGNWVTSLPEHCVPGIQLCPTAAPELLLPPHRASLFLAYYAFCSMIWLVESRDDIVDPRISRRNEIVSSVLRVAENLVINRAPPCFEYHISMVLAVLVEQLSESGNFWSLARDNGDFSLLLNHLKSVTSTWSGALVSTRYFTNLINNNNNNNSTFHTKANNTSTTISTPSSQHSTAPIYRNLDFVSGEIPGAAACGLPSYMGEAFDLPSPSTDPYVLLEQTLQLEVGLKPPHSLI